MTKQPDQIGDFIKQATDLAICVGTFLTDLDINAPLGRQQDSLQHLRIAYERLQEGVSARMEARHAQG